MAICVANKCSGTSIAELFSFLDTPQPIFKAPFTEWTIVYEMTNLELFFYLKFKKSKWKNFQMLININVKWSRFFLLERTLMFMSVRRIQRDYFFLPELFVVVSLNQFSRWMLIMGNNEWLWPKFIHFI